MKGQHNTRYTVLFFSISLLSNEFSYAFKSVIWMFVPLVLFYTADCNRDQISSPRRRRNCHPSTFFHDGAVFARSS